MTHYAPPVAALLQLGEPVEPLDETNRYSQYGIGSADVPELIRLLKDDELAWGDSDTPEVFAQLHAWRALGQLQVREAIEPLLDLLAQPEDDDKWNDWLTEEVPTVLSWFGPSIIPAVVARLEQRGLQEDVPSFYANTLVEVARRNLVARAEVIDQLCRVLATASANNESLNGFIVSNLVDLNATDAWPAIESAFATGNVDESIVGDAPYVKYKLGLGPMPSERSGGWFLPSRQQPRHSGSNARQRFNERMRKKKAEKKKNKKKRK